LELYEISVGLYSSGRPTVQRGLMSSADECEHVVVLNHVCTHDLPTWCGDWSTTWWWAGRFKAEQSRSIWTPHMMVCMKGLRSYSLVLLACLLPCCMQRWTFARRGKPCSLHVIPFTSQAQKNHQQTSIKALCRLALGGLGVEPQLSEITAKAYRAKVGPTTKKSGKRCPFGTVGSLFVMQYHPYFWVTQDQ
jgi:hypothetical protein